jgi:hypothetical protein
MAYRERSPSSSRVTVNTSQKSIVDISVAMGCIIPFFSIGNPIERERLIFANAVV